MTSKQALEQIKRSHYIAMAIAILIDGKMDEETEQAISIIEKELEVLDILKDNVVCKDGTTTTFDIRDEKVREWLDNDK